MTILVPILGDQLSCDIASLQGIDPAEAVVLMMEVADETIYVRHHRRKLAYILSAMRHHAEALCAAGWRVDYVKLDDPAEPSSFTGEIARAIERHTPDRIVVTEAGEWRVQAMLESWETLFGIPVEIRTDTRFIASHADFENWAEGRNGLVMEFFYREQRKKTGLLMTPEGKPEGGRWNFDIELRFPELLGSLDEWDLAVTRDDAEKAQTAFLDHALHRFGDFQDAMVTGAHRMWHSLLSPYINSGLLDPLELCREVEARYRAGKVALNCAEGFIRQIIGWREFMRGIYWLAGPDYIERNHLDAHRRLPSFYWTGDTDMNCLSEVIRQTWTFAYAHHIQRLMVTGNFAALIGADPKAVHLWYMEVYFDAYEWVTLPNTLGMSQFGDGGLVGTKPYVSSAAYINRMSEYCARCRFDPGQRVGENACPFNALYWAYFDRNRDRLEKNPRLRQVYHGLDRLGAENLDQIRKAAQGFVASLDESAYGP